MKKSPEGLIPGFSTSRIETAKFVIHTEPRMSATKLAEYVIANPSRQKTIAKYSKKAPKVVLIPYKRVRSALPIAFTEDGLSAEQLLKQASVAKAAPYQNDWQKGDNERSREALCLLAEVADQIECAGATFIHRPPNGWGSLDIEGVRVSVNPELVFSVNHRGVTKVGAVILNTGKGDDLSLARSNGKHSVGDYLTTLVYRLLERRFRHIGVPLHARCYAIDIFRRKVYSAPSSHKSLNKHLESACEMIALRWGTIAVESGAEIDEYLEE